MTAVWALFFPVLFCSIMMTLIYTFFPYYTQTLEYVYHFGKGTENSMKLMKKIKYMNKKDISKFTFHYLVIIPHFTTRLKSLAPTMGGLDPLSTAPCQKIEALKLLILFHYTFLKSLQSWYSTSHNVIIVLHLIIKYIGMYRCIISTTAYI